MELNGENTSAAERLDRLQYTAGRLRRAKYDDLLGGVVGARENYLARLRAFEDRRGPLVLAIADREGIDDELDTLAKDCGANLRGRSATAATEPPYTQLVPQGMDAITLANIAETPGAYLGLVERAQKFLPAEDPVRVRLEAEVPPLVDAFRLAQEAVQAALRDRALARLEVDAAEDDADRVYEKVAGALIERVGKKAADRFFWKRTARKQELPEE